MTISVNDRAVIAKQFASGTDSEGRQVAMFALHPESAGVADAGGAAAADREIVSTLYRCSTAATGMSVGDVISHVQVLDVTGTPSTVASIWRNQSTNTDMGSAPSAANLEIVGAAGLTNAQLVAALGYNLGTPVDSTGLPLPNAFDYLAVTRTFNPDGSVATEARTNGTNTWTQTYGYTSGNNTSVSQWVKS